MLFTSPAFYLLFLPLVLVAMRLATRGGMGLTTAARLVIIGSTYVFYGAAHPGYLLPFAFATIADLTWSYLLARTERSVTRRAIVAASVVQNLSIFFVFKYVNFFVTLFPGSDPLRAIQNVFAGVDGRVELPPGVSFYLFESLSYVIDVYRRRVQASKHPLDFLTFISMFPRFIAGPIVRYGDIESSIHNYRGMRAADGLLLFALGFCVKALFADSCATFAEPLFDDHADFGLVTAWLSMFAYSFQIYLDFSGYSLMAIGLGLALGFPFLDNFREPYHARGISDFWRRWHISLSTWLRDYLYISLGGNRHGALRTHANLVLTMALGGIWHGANSTFLVWGLYQGFFLVVERAVGERARFLTSRAFTFLTVLFGWVWFRSPNNVHALSVYRGMFGLTGFGTLRVLASLQHNPLSCVLAAIGLLWVLWIEPHVRVRRDNRPWHALSIEHVPAGVIALVGGGFLLSLAITLSEVKVPFLYFQF